MAADPTILAVAVLYLAALLGIGFVAARRTRSAQDFFLAGRSLGSWVTAISSTASSESGWVVLGAVGLAYKEGVAALWFAPGCLAGYAINLYWLAPRLRRESERQGSLTIPDFLCDRFGDPRHLVRLVSVAIILVSLAGYLAAQMTATGKAMQAVLHLEYRTGILVGGAIIVAYTWLGGFRAVSWTDFLQGLIMVLALTLMPALAIAGAGGYGDMLGTLGAADPSRISVSGGRTGIPLIGFVVGLLGIGLGYPGQPHVVTRYMAAASEEKIRQSQVIAMCWGALVFYGAGFLGLAGRVLMPELGGPGGDPEQLFPLLAQRLLHPLLAGVMLAAILSAIMSTVSSQLLVAASSVSRDLLGHVLGRAPTDRTAVRVGRIAVVVVGAAAMAVALAEVRVVFWFVLFAWSGLGAAFGPVLLLTLTTGGITRAGALAGMFTGFGVTVAWKVTGLSERLVYELVPAFALATAATWIVSRLGPGRADTSRPDTSRPDTSRPDTSRPDTSRPARGSAPCEGQ